MPATKKLKWKRVAPGYYKADAVTVLYNPRTDELWLQDVEASVSRVENDWGVSWIVLIGFFDQYSYTALVDGADPVNTYADAKASAAYSLDGGFVSSKWGWVDPGEGTEDEKLMMDFRRDLGVGFYG